MSNGHGVGSIADFDALLRQHAESRAKERLRTLEEHDAHLRQYGTGDADYAARRSYMREHGLEYRNGPDGRRVLVWTPPTAQSESAYDAQQRVTDSLREYQQAQGQRLDNRSMTTPLESYYWHMQRKAERSGQIPPMNEPIPPTEQVARTAVTPTLMTAQMLRAPGKMFSRSDILAILRGHLALAQQRPPEMNERDAIRALIAVFENLE